MSTLAVVFSVSLLSALGFLWLRAAEIRANRRFALAAARHAADGWLETYARAVGSRARAAEHRAVATLRATPHHLADLAAALLRLVATRALRTLRWIHERRVRGHAPTGASKGAVSFFVSSLGETARPNRSAAR